MLVDKFKEIAKGAGWKFNYGKYHWQNLLDLLNDDTIHLLLLWQDRDVKYSDFNVATQSIYTGELLLVKRSELNDKDYNFKYEYRIKRLQQQAELISGNISSCDNLYLQCWHETEVENELDTNVDGLKIKFTIRNEY